MNKCKSCKYGGSMLGSGGVIYKFIRSIKSKADIDYNKDEHGCRMDQWNDKEELCLSNNFSEYEKLI